MPPLSDPQRDKLYELESHFNGWWGVSRTPRHLLKKLAADVCKHYGVDPVRVVVSRKDVKHEGDYEDGLITLYAKRGDNVGVLMHELAHHIVEQAYEDVENHGPEFCRAYMNLLDEWAILPKMEFQRLARKVRLKL